MSTSSLPAGTVILFTGHTVDAPATVVPLTDGCTVDKPTAPLAAFLFLCLCL